VAIYGLQRIVAPVALAVELADAKAFCRVDADITSDNDLLTMLIRSATGRAEFVTERAIITQTWRLSLDGFPTGTGALVLPRPPLQAVTAVRYYDTAGVLQTLAPTGFAWDGEAEPGWLVPAVDLDWPDTDERLNAVQVEFRAGYGDSAAAVPEGLREAILSWVGWRFANRAVPVPPELDYLFKAYELGVYR
jgi:uncharacterized phiE125 gp8 family phage protein